LAEVLSSAIAAFRLAGHIGLHCVAFRPPNCLLRLLYKDFIELLVIVIPFEIRQQLSWSCSKSARKSRCCYCDEGLTPAIGAI